MATTEYFNEDGSVTSSSPGMFMSETGGYQSIGMDTRSIIITYDKDTFYSNNVINVNIFKCNILSYRLNKGKVVNIIISILWSIILIFWFIKIYINEDEKEKSLLLILVLIFFLCSFKLQLDQYPIPLGYLVYLIFVRNNLRTNIQAKRQAAIAGLVTFLISAFLPVITEEIGNNKVIIETDVINAKSFIMQDFIDDISWECGIPVNSKIENYNISFFEDGSIERMKFILSCKNGEQYSRFHFRSNDGYEWNVRTYMDNRYPQYNRLCDTPKFIRAFDSLINMNGVFPEGEFVEYCLSFEGYYQSVDMKDRQTFALEKDSLNKVPIEDLPAEGYWIMVYGMAMNTYDSEDSPLYNLSGEGYINYLFK